MLIPKTRRGLLPLLEAQGLTPRKQWGQNFLLDHHLLEAIVREAQVEAEDLVLEVGPGPGMLTEFLLARAKFLVGVEIDQGMSRFLWKTLQSPQHFLLLNLDILPQHNQFNPEVCQLLIALMKSSLQTESSQAKALFSEIVTQQLNEQAYLHPDFQHKIFSAHGASKNAAVFKKLKVVSNLPYSISSPFLIALLENSYTGRLNFHSATLLLPFDVAQKLISQPGQKTWGMLAFLTQLFARVKLLRKVPAECFWPRPKIDSMLVQLLPLPQSEVFLQPTDDYSGMKAFIQILFRYRRKSIATIIRKELKLDQKLIQELLASESVPAKARVEELEIPLVLKLVRKLQALWKDSSSSS